MTSSAVTPGQCPKEVMTSSPSTSLNMTFIHQLMDTIKWIDEEAHLLSREDVLDKVRARLVDITHAFVAYPHCANFSLMPEGGA